MQDFRITYVGAGRMGEALIGGLIKTGYKKDLIRAVDPDASVRTRLKETYDIDVVASSDEAVRDADIILLAVKPQVIADILKKLGGLVTHEQLVISVAAGVSTKAIEKFLVDDVPVVRTMPNAAAIVRASITAISAGKNAGNTELKIAESIFNCVGKTVILDESLINAVTALSGSGPAYFYLFVQALAGAGVEAGIDKDVALRLAHETMFGSSRMLKYSDETPSELIGQVRSPGGTTAAALDVFADSDLEGIVDKAFKAALDRAKELEID